MKAKGSKLNIQKFFSINISQGLQKIRPYF